MAATDVELIRTGLTTLIVVKSTEMANVDEITVTHASLTSKPSEVERWLRRKLNAQGIAFVEVDEVNGDTGETNRQEELRDAAAFYWAHAYYRHQAKHVSTTGFAEKADEYLRRANEAINDVLMRGEDGNPLGLTLISTATIEKPGLLGLITIG